ncbi:GTP pyrophosphokinase family protein [Lactobacillus sp. LC28-10]|uniref:GTP pyrophosphokinase family protein n=1 Tax=Secundilactobacillus angelensis TaxID=2722706 RepID=A0ABX1KVT5_9LACO|nr:GTP pyrophosphokinase family protein [Secundilactobacillus angelensis]MCH5461863.1 GTP pyrophosphokinase family protein [Secundilactobacillus angelensis]NLR17350.1 GTP pyrophosphokinase family protein [Secundilactobacillus angelensis]
MILQRNNVPNINQISDEMSRILGDYDTTDLRRFFVYYQQCQAGAKEFGAKLENLDSEFEILTNHNPIHHMETRMKAPQSLMRKLRKKGYDFSFDAIKNNIFDIAGIRVITNYIEDINTVEEALTKQTDVTLLKRKDYISHPKPSGYRSLHLVVSVPVFRRSGPVSTPVEIQLRTVGMDMWASLEHKLRYKTNVDQQKVEKYGDQLKGYSAELNQIETNMQAIFNDLQKDQS